MPPGWVWFLIALGAWLLLCAMVCVANWRTARRLDRDIPEWEQEQMAREYAERLDVDEVELYAHADYDAYRFGYRLPGERDIAARQAAEINQQGRRR